MFLKTQVRFIDTNKMERLSSGPIGFSSLFPLWDKKSFLPGNKCETSRLGVHMTSLSFRCLSLEPKYFFISRYTLFCLVISEKLEMHISPEIELVDDFGGPFWNLCISDVCGPKIRFF